MSELKRQSELNKRLIKLLFDQCEYISDIFEELFQKHHLIFNRASIEEIAFSSYPDFALIFLYYPEKYEYGKIMLNKGIDLQLSKNPAKRYNIKDIALYLGKTGDVEIEKRDPSLSPLNHHKLIIENYLTEILESKDFSWEEGLKQKLAKQNFFR